MKHTCLMISVALLAVGCASTPDAPDDSDTVQMKNDTVKEIEEQRAAEKSRRPPPPPREEATMPPEELAVQMYEVSGGDPVVTENGIAISVASSKPPWAFTLSKSGQSVKAVDPGGELYIEGVAFGELFVFSKFGDATQVTLRSDAPQSPLTLEEASRIADAELAGRLDCKGTRDPGTAQPTGTVVFSVTGADGSISCQIVVGRFTRGVVDL